MLKVWKKKRQMFLDKGSPVWYNVDTRIGNYAFSNFVLFGDVEKAVQALEISPNTSPAATPSAVYHRYPDSGWNQYKLIL